MRWFSSGRVGDDVEERDLRHRRTSRGVAVGGGVVLATLLVLALIGVPRQLFHGSHGGADNAGPALERPMGLLGNGSRFGSSQALLSDSGEVWGRFVPAFDPPKLVVATGGTAAGCGHASGAIGTYYCPSEHRVYVDQRFLNDLRERAGSSADLAEAYVVAHEFGHHIQTLTGLTDRIEALRAQTGTIESDQVAIRQELQADCYAGVWAHHSSTGMGHHDTAEIEAGLAAVAAAAADLQQRAHGQAVPDNFTHGTGEQRSDWFRRGFGSGEVDDCSTFEVTRL